MFFQFRDFLVLYNKLTELCFKQCTDNFFSREVSQDESTCLDRCVIKFSRVNQRIMNAYVEDQTAIQARRMKEIEAQMQTVRDAETAAANAATNLTVPPSNEIPSEVADASA